MVFGVISKVSILGDKAVIKQNKFGVWQFRMWISSEKKYVEKSLRTKKKTDAVDLAEELYIQLRNELANGKTKKHKNIFQSISKRFDLM